MPAGTRDLIEQLDESAEILRPDVREEAVLREQRDVLGTMAVREGQDGRLVLYGHAFDRARGGAVKEATLATPASSWAQTLQASFPRTALRKGLRWSLAVEGE